MIRETKVDSILNRLTSALGNLVVVRPPASTEDIAGLEHVVGSLPRDFRILLMTCDGLRVQVPAPARTDEWHLWHVSEIMASILTPMWPCVPPAFVPFRGDPTGVRDCLVAGPGPVAGSVVRWDPWGQDVRLLCSAFGTYLERWADYLIDRIGRAAADKRCTCWPAFDEAFIGEHDPAAVTLRSQQSVRDWLSEIEHLVGNGDDFE